jgi:hypothetical protein
MGAETVLILAGREKLKLTIHINLLLEDSPYFKELLGEHHTERRVQKIKLPDEYADDWALFYEFLYSERLDSLSSIENPEKATAPLKYIQLYCFAEKRNIEPLMDLTADRLASSISDGVCAPGTGAIAYAYSNSRQNSPICSIVLMWYSNATMNENIEGTRSRLTARDLWEIGHDFPDLGISLLRLLRGENFLGFKLSGSGRKCQPESVKNSQCIWHQHTVRNDPRCPRGNNIPDSPEARTLVEKDNSTVPQLKDRPEVPVSSKKQKNGKAQDEEAARDFKKELVEYMKRCAGAKTFTVKTFCRRLGVDQNDTQQTLMLRRALESLANSRNIKWLKKGYKVGFIGA